MRRLHRIDRDYQFKDLFFPHTYGFILLKDIGMQIRLSRAHQIHVCYMRVSIALPREYDDVTRAASYDRVRFYPLDARRRVYLTLETHYQLRTLRSKLLLHYIHCF